MSSVSNALGAENRPHTRADIPSLVGQHLSLLAPAKPNLRIKLEGRRDDGFHLLSMFNVLTSLSDEMRIAFKADGGVEIAVADERAPTDPAVNLASRAADLFLKKFDLPIGVAVHLGKRIPIGAGFGGGSSDAGTVLRALYGTFSEIIEADPNNTARSDLVALAADLGSDVPFFFHGRFARVTGVGEKVERYDGRFLTQQRALLIVPSRGISTTELYSRVRVALPEMPLIRDLKGEQFGETLRLNTAVEGYEPFPSRTIRASLWRHLVAIIENDFERFILELAPEFRELLDGLRSIPDAVVSFTGSGSGMFLLGRGLDAFAKVKEQALRKVEGAGCRIEDVALLDVAP